MKELEMFEFRKHFAGFQAVANYENGFGISVIPEPDGVHYEAAIFRGGKLCYDSGLSDDVCRYLTVTDVHNLILRIRNLKEGTRVVPPHPYVSSY